MKIKRFREIYKICFNFIKESKNYLFFTISIFLLFSVLGYFYSIPTDLERQLLELLKQITEKFSGLNVFQTIWLIFSNNLVVSFLVLVLGVAFGIFPIVTAISNGFIVGYVASKAVSLQGITILWKLFPHGIFEIPAVLISIAIGIKLGFELLKKGQLKKNIIKAFYLFFFVVFPLLVIAAIIEGLLVFFIK